MNKILATEPGRIAAKAAATCGPGRTASRSASRTEASPSPRLAMTGTSPTASKAGENAVVSSANTAPGPTSAAISRIRPWSADSSEYAVLTGTTGTPAVIAASEITR